MEQITAMKITGVTFTDFRNHKAPESYAFGDVSYITGHNGTGKTTMAHGVCYALYGVSYYGEQKIERLMNENAAGTQVQLDFTDQDGNPHTLIRNRNGDKTTLLLDSYTIRQTDIERMFCDKDTFLSMFNPTYLTERLGEKGRALILKYLRPVSANAVLEQMSESYREFLNGIDLSTSAPEVKLKEFRKAIRQAEDQETYLQGHIDSFESTRKTSVQKLSELCAEKEEIEAKRNALAGKQFDGIEVEDLSIQRDMLLKKLADIPDGEKPRLTQLRAKIEEIRHRPYVSKYTQAIAENAAEIKSFSERYKALVNRVKSLKPGTQCPTCLMRITEQNLPDVKAGMMAELKKLAEQGRERVAQGKELAGLDAKSKTVFEQFKAEDLKKLSRELQELEAEDTGGREEIRTALEKVEQLQKFGNLEEDEYSELNCLTAELTGIDAQIQAVRDMADEKKLKDAYMQKDTYAQQIIKYKNVLSALSEFLCKRTEIAVAGLQMPNVKIKLFDVVRSTGEVVNTFKFTYKGRDYTTLSLSEKTLAGIEITAMIRKITGIDCPVCVDNTESIAAFNSVSMPSQTLLLRFVKGQPLTVQSRNRTAAAGPAVQELKKAS